MSPARRIALSLSRNSLRLVLATLLTAIAFKLVFETPTAIKAALSATSASQRVVPALLESSSTQDPNGLFSDKKAQEIIQSAFTPQFITAQSNVFIDAVYSWLRGDTAMISFKIDITQQRVQVAEALSIYGIERLAALPECTAFEPNLQLDPFKATCQPAGINYKKEQQSLQNALLSSKTFLPKTVYTGSDLPRTKSGKTVEQSYNYIPVAFSALDAVIAALGILLLLNITTLVLLRPVRRNGWKDTGKALVYVSFALALSAGIFGIAIPKITRSYQSQLFGGQLNILASEIITHISVAFQTAFISAAAVFIAAGILILLLVRYWPQSSRYARLQRVTGITNAVAPPHPNGVPNAAIYAPVVTSEKPRHTSAQTAMMKRMKAQIKKELS